MRRCYTRSEKKNDAGSVLIEGAVSVALLAFLILQVHGIFSNLDNVGWLENVHAAIAIAASTTVFDDAATEKAKVKTQTVRWLNSRHGSSRFVDPSQDDFAPLIDTINGSVDQDWIELNGNLYPGSYGRQFGRIGNTSSIALLSTTGEGKSEPGFYGSQPDGSMGTFSCCGQEGVSAVLCQSAGGYLCADPQSEGYMNP